MNILFFQIIAIWPNINIDKPHHSDSFKRVLTEVPVIRLNFYMMGKDGVDHSIKSLVEENVSYLNAEFEGRVKFEINLMESSLYIAYLPDLRVDYIEYDGSLLDHLIEPIEIQGSVNVYLFDTYFEEDKNGSLMGFTPIMTAKHKMYEEVTPMFDRIHMAYEGLENKSTLVHEMGHFLGLSHPWEMSDINKHLMGLTDKETEEHNHMGYHPDVESFTFEQLERMREFALMFRKYLLVRVEYFYMDSIYSQ